MWRRLIAWLLRPLDESPPIPRDENMRGLGWAGAPKPPKRKGPEP